MSAAETANSPEWEQRLLRYSARPVPLKPEYQELKFTLHRKLLDRINLDALANIDDDRIRGEVRQAVLAMVADEPNLLTAAEKQQISDEVLHEVFGLGPLEPLLAGPDHLRHPGERPPAGLCGAQGHAGADQRALPRRPATCCASSTRSCPRWAAGWTSRTPWWTLD